MTSSTISVKGQIVIPARLRKKYNIKTGTKVHFLEETEGIRIVPIKEEFIDKNAGILDTRGRLLKTLSAEKEKEKKL